MLTASTVDLSNCDREPIHIPGSIQPHGCLLACDPGVTVIRRYSANATSMLRTEGELKGRQVADLLGEDATHDLRNAIAQAPDASRPAVIAHLRLPNGDHFDIAVHRQQDGAILEFEPSLRRTQPLQLAREMIGRVKDIADIDLLISSSAKLVRTVLGYDRVMIYRFEDDGSGKVASEAKRADLESFLGQYFPASDIPRQARILYMQNPIRVISDASGTRVPLLPQDDEARQPLDLSFAHLRSVSPIHCEYLRNMGVAASMSISIIVDDKLWGLIACHHYAPKTLTMSERIAAEMFGEFFSLHLLSLRQKRKLDITTEARRALDRFLQSASHQTDVDQILASALPEFQKLLACDGVGLWMKDRWTAIGTVPPQGEEEALAAFVSRNSEGRIWGTKSLSTDFPEADYPEVVSGVLSVPLSQIPRDYLFFFRKERLQTLNWAGNPEKTYEVGPLGDRLTPRKSFAIWKETVRHQAEGWREADFEIAEAIRSATVEIVLRHNELMQEERSKADIRQRMLNEELNHRVKNILAVIKSLVAAPGQEEVPIEHYIGSLRGRIHALSHAHDQLTRGGGGGSLSDLLQAELLPYRAGLNTLTLTGGTVTLDARAHAVAALVIHELCTNAAKYGALSRPGGALTVEWQRTADDDCLIRWNESGGPAIGPIGRKGFGTALIERSIPYDLGGTSHLDYKPEGLAAEFCIPGRFLSWETPAIAEELPPVQDAQPTGQSQPLQAGLPVLLVEDQVLIAMDAEMMLADAGIENVVTASSSTDALNRLKSFRPAIAILDINLGRDTSVPVAEELARLGIPFVFATGYDDRSIVPEGFADVPVVRKPYDSVALLKALSDRLQGR
ncbi:HWE histidine kinase domain-containing protein [Rhizobium sp. AG855]|uniref:HWE histidine kinase domain-containing protein n=1 Tax=Rhizobium sp. AG855 TaxID=2183898 RepID=UPI000E76BF91|nr:HWE histidine kinase domain-containing protein [Rhizobium sp. AG855]RKE83929.1 light-regulated signal transduction histidine kinase (bacteriophytochrome) [Rhizobium sp. AG855]